MACLLRVELCTAQGLCSELILPLLMHLFLSTLSSSRHDLLPDVGRACKHKQDKTQRSCHLVSSSPAAAVVAPSIQTTLICCPMSGVPARLSGGCFVTACHLRMELC
jgi:hypothetical protein